MLKITIPPSKYWDAKRGESGQFFTYPEKPVTLQMEHSLVSLSKWEAKWQKPFLSNTTEKTPEEMIDYFRCMTITQNVDPNLYYFIPEDIGLKIREYIQAPMTATTFGKEVQKPSREIVTSELIYYWMTALNIPFECEKWHLNRLMTLIKVCSIKNAPQKKMSASEIRARNKALNDSRRKAMHTRG